MERITATVQGGRFVPDAPVGLPDGTRVTLDLVSTNGEGAAASRPWPTTPEGIEELIRELEAIEPAILTPQEEGELAEFRAAVKRKDIESVRKQMGLTP
jgi:hypothetical protein